MERTKKTARKVDEPLSKDEEEVPQPSKASASTLPNQPSTSKVPGKPTSAGTKKSTSQRKDSSLPHPKPSKRKATHQRKASKPVQLKTLLTKRKFK
ncbi:hypothetical protein GOP47_0021996 [Adiantum capillus-veneris]|uniref:Uncharacterized protein n=1 Tax=Adiantum capillus-veneris TaxID=13818 RepID=A0A9D4UA82_ADICA|nr:hypothetical protein GOP47_0021996 [Adiantum capillus-veneris]